MCRGSQLTAAALSLPSRPCCVNSAAWLRGGRGGQTYTASQPLAPWLHSSGCSYLLWSLGSRPISALVHRCLSAPGQPVALEASSEPWD